jgi:hypothetical protein
MLRVFPKASPWPKYFVVVDLKSRTWSGSLSTRSGSSLQKGYPEEIQNIAVGSYDIPLVKAIFPETEGDFPREFHDPCTGLDFREILQHCRSHRMRNDRVPDLGIGIDPVQGHTVDSLSMVNEARMLSVNLT